MMKTDWSSKWAEYSPIKTAVKNAGEEDGLTYQKLNQLAHGLADHFIRELGFSRGDRIAVLAEFCTEYVVLFSAAQKAGLILVPLNFRLTGPELDYIIGNCTPSLIIFDDKYKEQIIGQPAFESLNNCFSMEELAGLLSEGTMSGNWSKSFLEPPSFRDPLFILYTSGTTGFPKGAIYTHKMAFWNSINTQLRLDITSGDHTIVCTPPFHTGGWNVLLTPFLHHGGSVSLLKKFDPDHVLKLLEEEEATIFMGVPTMLKMMAESETFSKVNLKKLRYFIVGGEAMPIPLIKVWQEEKGIPIRQGYGLTEVGPNITSLHHDDALRKIGSIGKPNFYLQTRLVTSEGREAAVNEEGELWINGPVVTPGYWNNPKGTEEAIEEGWFKTGDVLTRDEEGYLYVRDRIKNMFISGGENVYPAEVEKVIQQMVEVHEVAVIAVPDERWGEVGKALVVKKGSTLNEEQVIAHCKQKLAKFKIPKHVSFVEEIPKTDSGKIDRKALK
jgi:fatty-acyl-CoA synthase